MMRRIVGVALCIGLLLTIGGRTEGNSIFRAQKPSRYKPYRSPFRYVIFREGIENITNDSENAKRYVDVLLDKEAFSEATLAELFKLLSKRFPEPEWMFIDVYTNLEQADTPEEGDQAVISDGPDNPWLDKYPRAFLIRQKGNELFRYYIPSLPKPRMKTVILKGRDPYDTRR